MSEGVPDVMKIVVVPATLASPTSIAGLPVDAREVEVFERIQVVDHKFESQLSDSDSVTMSVFTATIAAIARDRALLQRNFALDSV